jgi:superfamily II DNA or RNA helicase
VDIELRPYQRDCLTETLSALREHRSALFVMPTGTGKTVVFCALADARKERGRTLIIAGRKELIHQAIEKMNAVSPHLACDIEMNVQRADAVPWDKAPVVVTSVQTQIAGRNGWRRMMKFAPEEFGTIVVDEAHGAVAPSWRHVIDYYRNGNDKLSIVGCTATPDRHDEKALGQVFESVSYEYWLADAINDGWLVPIRQEYVEIEDYDISDCHVRAGDLTPGELDRHLGRQKPAAAIAYETLKRVEDKKTLVFCAGIHQAELTCAQFNAEKPGCAAFVSYKTPQNERDAIIGGYRKGEFQVLVQVLLASEGFDVPDIGVVVCARPTLSRPRYEQMIGRGTRPVAGDLDHHETETRKQQIEGSAKPWLHVIDLVGNSGRHKLVSCMDILGGIYEDDVPDLAVREAQKRHEPVDAMDALAQAAKKRREQKRQEQLELARKMRIRTTSRSRWVDPFDVFDITPRRTADYHLKALATDKQINRLIQMRVDFDPRTLTKAQASQLIGMVIQRRERGLCTYPQLKTLKKFRIDATNWTFEQASRKLDQLIGGRKRNGRSTTRAR